MLDWDDLRFFLAIARHRTLSAAAKHLHVTQSTVGRRLASLQARMGVRLLQHTGLCCTDQGCGRIHPTPVLVQAMRA